MLPIGTRGREHRLTRHRSRQGQDRVRQDGQDDVPRGPRQPHLALRGPGRAVQARQGEGLRA